MLESNSYRSCRHSVHCCLLFIFSRDAAASKWKSIAVIFSYWSILFSSYSFWTCEFLLEDRFCSVLHWEWIEMICALLDGWLVAWLFWFVSTFRSTFRDQFIPDQLFSFTVISLDDAFWYISSGILLYPFHPHIQELRHVSNCKIWEFITKEMVHRQCYPDEYRKQRY